MASQSQEKSRREYKRDREAGADYYLGKGEEDALTKETSAPYKLEPDASEIEEFLMRLRQEGL